MAETKSALNPAQKAEAEQLIKKLEAARAHVRAMSEKLENLDKTAVKLEEVAK